MQYWMAEGEKGHHSKVYKIIWSSIAFLCTVRLFLHPSPSTSPSSFGPRNKMVVTVLSSMPKFVPALAIITVIERFLLVSPGMRSHVMRCSCLWMSSVFLLKNVSSFTHRACLARSPLSHCGSFCARKHGWRGFYIGKSRSRWLLVCFLICVGAVSKECASLHFLCPQVCGSFQISQRAGSRTWGQSQGVYQCLHQELRGWYGWWAAEGAFWQIW